MSTLDPMMREKHHFHACSNCGNVWSHDPPADDITSAEFKRMHSCNVCGSDRNCDLAAETRHEVEELAVHDYITINGKRYYAPDLDDPFCMLMGRL